MFKKYFIYLSIFTFTTVCFAQKSKETEADNAYAKELFVNQNFKKAMEEYQVLLKKDSTNITYKHNLALCYLNLNIEYDKCIQLLENISFQPKCDPNVWYDLASVFQKMNRFEIAIKNYRKFIELVINKDNNYIPASRQIEMCENVISLMKKPVNVSFENLGNDINSVGPDLRPYISADENLLVFTSKRIGNIGSIMDVDGFNTSDIFLSNYNGKWTKPKRLPAIINTPVSEDCTGLTADGITMMIHYDNNKMMGDLLMSELKGRSFLRPLQLSPMINTEKDETAACLSPDKQTLFFASSRKGGEGAKDLYYSRKLPSGDWSEAVNLGSNINTKYDENYPYISPDGETLYFCSVGHNSMGGYDIFKAKWDKEAFTFSEPENIGYPINTSDDERSISFTQSGRFAYMDANKKDGMGNRDIYKLFFNDIPAAYTVITGKISIGDTSMSETTDKLTSSLTDEIKISVIDKKTTLLKGKYAPNKISGKYVVILPPGEYLIKFEGSHINAFDFEQFIPDRETTDREIDKNIVLTLKSQ